MQLSKNIIYISILSAVLALSMVFNVIQTSNVNQSRKAEKLLIEKLNKVTYEKDSVVNANSEMTKLFAKYEFVNDSLNTLNLSNQAQIKYLNKQLNKLSKEISKLTDEEVLNELANEYDFDVTSSSFNASGEYYFASDTRRDILLETKRADYLDSLYFQQRLLVERQSVQILLKDNIIEALREDNLAKEKLLQKLYVDMGTLTANNQMSDAEVKRLKKVLVGWKIGAFSAGAAVAALLIIL